jgi:hypothetical protein
MAWMRAVCGGLCEHGLLRITQRGVTVGCAGYKGPVRVALTEAGRALAAAAEQGAASRHDTDPATDADDHPLRAKRRAQSGRQCH